MKINEIKKTKQVFFLDQGIFNGDLCIRWHYAILKITQHETNIGNL